MTIIHHNNKNDNYIKNVVADVNKKIKNYRLYMEGITQKKQKVPYFHCGLFKKNENLEHGKKFIRLDSKRKLFKKSNMIDDNNNDINSNSETVIIIIIIIMIKYY